MYEKVPVLGRDEAYFIGNGIVGAAINADSEVTLSVGRDYTSPNFIKRETIKIAVNATNYEFRPSMHRIRHTGVFAGSVTFDDVGVEIADFTLPGKPFLLRILKLKNQSDKTKVVETCIEVQTDKQTDKSGSALRIVVTASDWCFGNKETMNWKERFCEIGFANGGIIKSDDIISEKVQIEAKGEQELLIYHYHYDEDNPYNDEDIMYISSTRPYDLFAQSLLSWQDWFGEGNFMSDKSKVQDVIEGCLIAVKTQQNSDGGMIAGIHKYANSYVRDCHGGFRLLIATGHYDEAQKIILNIHAKFQAAGFIPNWWSMGSDAFIGHTFNNDASEITAYYLFMLRDYIKATGNEELFETVYDSAGWAADAQLRFMLANNYLMDFNGDETEQYVCKQDGEEYGGFPAVEGWAHINYSFAATCAALTSLEFFAEFVKRLGYDDEYSQHFCSIRSAIDRIFFRSDIGLHSWAVNRETMEPLDNIVTNYNLIPLWIGARLSDEKEKSDALGMLRYINKDTGFLPNSHPDVQGFCGHSLGLLLYCMMKLDKKSEARKIVYTILNSPLLSRWGTVNEFYGPGCVPNGHVYRAFESGILGEALLLFSRAKICDFRIYICDDAL